MRNVQVLRSTTDLGGLKRQGVRPMRVAAVIRIALVAAAVALAAGGCVSGGASPTLPGQSGRSADAGTPVPGTPDVGDIPPGRGIAEGGGGPMSYTFREEWRRALAAARAWHSGAYLVSGVGAFVNDDGVPSSWTFDFIDSGSPDAVLIVEIDPWGKVTGTREITGQEASSLLGPHAGRIPYAVVDSDTAVRNAKAALSSRYDLTNTRDPRLALGFSVVDGSGPNWTYTVFNKPSAAYVSARLDALSGAATLPD